MTRGFASTLPSKAASSSLSVMTEALEGYRPVSSYSYSREYSTVRSRGPHPHGNLAEGGAEMFRKLSVALRKDQPSSTGELTRPGSPKLSEQPPSGTAPVR